MQMLESQLAHTQAYVTGETFTLADIVLGLSAQRWHVAPIERPDLPALRAYREKLSERPGFPQARRQRHALSIRSPQHYAMLIKHLGKSPIVDSTAFVALNA